MAREDATTSDAPTVRVAVESSSLGALASFPFDRATVERFREAFPRARWRNEERAWFVPGRAAERRLERWFGREFASALGHADARGRDAFAFDGLESSYLEVADDLRIRTPFSQAVVGELRTVPWAWWDPDLKAWRVPFRSWEDLRRRWPAIEEAAQRNEPAERAARREARAAAPPDLEARERSRERRRRRFPTSPDDLPPLGRVLMGGNGAVIFTEITGEIADETTLLRFYPERSIERGSLVWASWRRPTHSELVRTWPSRVPAGPDETARGWRAPTIEELRGSRRKARSIERAQATRRASRQERGRGPAGETVA